MLNLIRNSQEMRGDFESIERREKVRPALKRYHFYLHFSFLNKFRHSTCAARFVWLLDTSSAIFNCYHFMESKLQKCSSADSSSAPKLVLYSYWKSSCAWRVRFALRLKGLPYEHRAVNLAKGEQLTPEFEKLNPLKYVPVLVDDDVVVSDSYAILLYLEEKYPHIPLLPTDPQLRAINLQAASIVSSSIQPLRMLSLLKLLEEKVGREEQLAWAQLHIEKGFLALEKLLKDYAGGYATGEKVYMADVFLAPEIAVATTGFNIDMSKFPVLNMIYEACNTLPEFQASLPDRQPDAEP